MKITVKERRGYPKELPEVVGRSKEVAITGRSCGKFVPYEKTDKPIIGDNKHDLFGIWADREDIESVEDYVRKMRN